MSHQFYVREELGEKIYKLIIIKLSRQEVMKIISKESKQERIHFVIRLSQINSDTEGILSEETKYSSIEKGVTKRQFSNLVDAMIAKMPENTEIKIHDLSHYSSLMDQFSTGVREDILRIITNYSTETSKKSHLP
jgi:hypothetical protein